MNCPECDTQINKFIISGDQCPECGFIFVLKDNMLVTPNSLNPTFLVSIVVPLTMTFIGTGIFMIGLRHAGTAVALFGVLFSVAFFKITLGRTPSYLIATGLRYAVVGGIGGAMLGLFAANFSQILIGLLGGIVFGALCGVVVAAFFLSGGSIFSHIIGNLIPKTVNQALYILAACIGAVVGAVNLIEISINIYGAVGGGVVLFSFFGFVAGLTIAYKVNSPYNPGS